jgi:hypothetical protein
MDFSNFNFSSALLASANTSAAVFRQHLSLRQVFNFRADCGQFRVAAISLSLSAFKLSSSTPAAASSLAITFLHELSPYSVFQLRPDIGEFLEQRWQLYFLLQSFQLCFGGYQFFRY